MPLGIYVITEVLINTMCGIISSFFVLGYAVVLGCSHLFLWALLSGNCTGM